ncbi:MAG: hypothetical protein HOH19_14000 [Kordiimonadaceae bacterium]|jgi:hypothetical protein|nr:hypothetical protein [Kordiimonadaceae bacterium]MBT6033685.1 hypothetical protein [Kordiimonadaceae bacterium]
MRKIIAIFSILTLFSCSAEPEINPVTKDVLFLVLGKMSIYLQSETGEHTLRDHHFVAEIMPNESGEILGGTLTSKDDPDFSLPFNPEGRQFLAHGARTMDPNELHQLNPDGTYIFNYKTKNGEMKGQPLSIKKRDTTDIMPEPATLTLSQDDKRISSNEINPDKDLKISWTQMKGNMKSDSSELEDLIFVLAFDCFGNNIAHSGRPYNGKPFLTYKDTSYSITASSLEPGISYNLIVEQATADVNRHQGVPGIATYATLTFLDGKTTGTALQNKACPTN